MSPLPQPLPTATLLGGPFVSVGDLGPRARVFAAFSCLFWLVMSMLGIGLSHGFSSEAPIAWSSIAIRMGSGFLINAAVYWVFELPRFRGLSRLVR